MGDFSFSLGAGGGCGGIWALLLYLKRPNSEAALLYCIYGSHTGRRVRAIHCLSLRNIIMIGTFIQGVPSVSALLRPGELIAV
jgi:hypothetical protein